jgi:low affinity Fe/Cu permease
LALFLSFWTIDAARLCGWFIQCISQGPTVYPQSTRRYFARLRGNVPEDILADWIDVQIIAEITERVGRLIYFPVIAFSILIFAHNSRLYNWSWITAGYVVAGCNLAVAAASIIILQHAARRARNTSASSLEAKIDEFKIDTDVTPQDTKRRSVDEAQRLLDEIKGLNTGAFAGFWGNPVVGALLLPAGGTALIELVSFYFMHS